MTGQLVLTGHRLIPIRDGDGLIGRFTIRTPRLAHGCLTRARASLRRPDNWFLSTSQGIDR